MWFLLIKQYWEICLFKRSPSDAPYSPLLLCMTIFFYVLLLVAQWITSDVDSKVTLSMALLIALALIISYGFYTTILLAVFKMRNRIVQTLTALFVTHGIIHLFVFPLLLITPLLVKISSISILEPILGLLYLFLTIVLTVWQLLISGFIYKHALSIDSFPGFLASLGLLACNILFVALI